MKDVMYEAHSSAKAGPAVGHVALRGRGKNLKEGEYSHFVSLASLASPYTVLSRQ